MTDFRASLIRRRLLASLAAAALAAPLTAAVAAGPTLLNVSYDVSREFYKDYNAAFQRYWKQTAGEDITINQSHGGSSKQARSVADGLQADVLTMNQANDVDILHLRGNLIPADWAKRLPDNSAPTTSTSVILVRKGNPKGIKGWEDLARPGVSVVIPNPKVSGNGRYTYLAAWGSVIKTGGDAAKAKELVRRIFANVPVFDGGGRAATTTFAQRDIGDALATFESEVPLIIREFGDKFDVVYPSWSILAENPVTVVDKVVDKKGTRRQAEAYLKYLWSDEGQEIAAKHHLRPRSEKVLAKYASVFPKINFFTVDEVFGGWTRAQKEHFDDGGVYDQILSAAKR
ncbi:sulfate ABC transporter substrate-binding protein [Caldimonas thermodepolymerans]|jgi:sulfate/thiosulfate-binding protein|uniref:Sulfate ABC transporter substrate-binding protein n=1 Tax=Caldimonas thermodepolymerans TaxID=215580 RepID=A0A2S5T899_9BURK|nr:sulfate ABC transporter substrate-binding protein [Caldimonas thermodepolymerans]PPE71201.1 sulfate ABC transporter substrate-binding protein [Caldimonas thermodepolymerans]QPC32374.1 sulfate ABC transporter substrate-binding protein [Caldimonas thermodepolymerans]RDH98755.1 sulfate transport system substrate-binding protein [Caldimonas thermodepolymerans]TCP06153.1 sulfate transport system substrate-binding protein [Caldimonas thermodepolymerans]UZG45165.1 sulfate ABC transporter substrate